MTLQSFFRKMQILVTLCLLVYGSLVDAAEIMPTLVLDQVKNRPEQKRIKEIKWGHVKIPRKEQRLGEMKADAKFNLEHADYHLAAKLYGRIAQIYSKENNWYAAAIHLLNQAECLLRLQQYSQAENLIRQSIDFLQKADCKVPSVQGKHLAALSRSLSFQSKFSDAEREANGALYYYSKAHDENYISIIKGYVQQATTLLAQRKTEEHEKALRSAIPFFKVLSASELSMAPNPFVMLASFLNMTNRRSEASALCLEGLKIYTQKEITRSPDVTVLKCQLAISLIAETDRRAEMLSSINDALANCEESEDLEWAFNIYHDWSSALIDHKQYQLANEFLARSLNLVRKRKFYKRPVCELFRDKIICEFELGNMKEALECVNESLSTDFAKEKLSDCSMEIRSVQAAIYQKQQDWKSALAVLKSLYTDRQEKYKNQPDHTLIATVMRRLGNVYFQLGNLEEADKYFQKALALDEKKFGPDDMALARPLQNIGSTYCVTGRYQEAVPYLDRALSIRDKHADSSHGDYGMEGNLAELSMVYMAMKEPDKARPLVERLFEMQDKGNGPSEIDAVSYLQSLAEAYVLIQREDEGKKLLDRVSSLRTKEKWRAKPIEELIKNLKLDSVRETTTVQ